MEATTGAITIDTKALIKRLEELGIYPESTLLEKPFLALSEVNYILMGYGHKARAIISDLNIHNFLATECFPPAKKILDEHAIRDPFIL